MEGPIWGSYTNQEHILILRKKFSSISVYFFLTDSKYLLMYLCMLHCSMYYYCCHVALPMTVSQCTVAVVAAVVVAAAWVWYGMEIENVKLCVDWLTGQRGLAAWDCDWGMIFGGASCACLTRWHTRLQKQSLMKIFSFRYGSLALEEEQSASSAQAGQSQFSSSPH